MNLDKGYIGFTYLLDKYKTKPSINYKIDFVNDSKSYELPGTCGDGICEGKEEYICKFDCKNDNICPIKWPSCGDGICT